MFTGSEIVATFEQLDITHVVWLPDSTFGQWESALEASSQLSLVRVCREGEAWAMAAGLHIGGRSPIVVMQSTGFFESGDAMRNALFDLQLPIFAIVGARNWLIADSRDSAKRFVEPVVKAWGLDYVTIREKEDKPKLVEHFRTCADACQPGAVLLAEGRG